MHEHPDILNLVPPGTYLETLAHPGGDPARKMELAVFKEHRFAFYFWNRWQKNRAAGTDGALDEVPGNAPPALLTVDWHRDLAPPSETEKRNLEKLNLSDPSEVARFMWSGLDTHNDSHLLSAAYLNLVGDVFLLKNYGGGQESNFSDRFGNAHRIFEFENYDRLEEAVAGHTRPFILDMDLDYFVKGKVPSHQLKKVEIYPDDEIKEVIDADSQLFRHLYPRLAGMTIATEPRYCGGILKSNHILKVVLSQLFTEDLQWKHLESTTDR